MAYPRSETIPRTSPEYNKVIRLEGQISTAISILSFRSFHAASAIAEHPLSNAVRNYLIGIRLLVRELLGRGIDLVHDANNVDDLVRLVQSRNFGYAWSAQTLSPTFRELPQHWPRIFYWQELQMILEEEGRDIGEALKEGWKFHMKEGGFPARVDPEVVAAGAIWRGMSEGGREEYMDKAFGISAAKVKEWSAEIERGGFSLEEQDPKVAAYSLLREASMVYPHITKEVYRPGLTDKPERDEISDCPICTVALKESELDTEAEHRPIKTKCKHVFGYNCLQQWFNMGNRTCPMCRTDLYNIDLNALTPKEVLQLMDRELLWVDRPSIPELPKSPHSYWDKLAAIFKPADEVRRRLLVINCTRGGVEEEQRHLGFCAVFLARDRLQAIVDGNVEMLNEVLPVQAQIHARNIFHEFMMAWHPDFAEDDDDADFPAWPPWHHGGIPDPHFNPFLPRPRQNQRPASIDGRGLGSRVLLPPGLQHPPRRLTGGSSGAQQGRPVRHPRTAGSALPAVAPVEGDDGYRGRPPPIGRDNSLMQRLDGMARENRTNSGISEGNDRINIDPEQDRRERINRGLVRSGFILPESILNINRGDNIESEDPPLGSSNRVRGANRDRRQ